MNEAAPQTPLDRFQYSYDRNSNRLYRENRIEATFSELYHTGGSSGSYDAVNQLLGFKRGTLNATKDDVTGTPQRTQSWALDEQGNWSTLTTNSVPQSRQHNYQNQATQVGGSPLTYDNNGNTQVDEAGRQYVYDAWNRLVEVKTSAGVRMARYSYDALGRRIKEEPGSGSVKDFYYSEQWQVLEERHAGVVKAQYVWSPVYVDALVLRDRNNDANPDLDERLYVQQDANWNVTALTNASGAVQERYVYDPYGQPTALRADWTSYGSGQESGLYDWRYLHQGGRYFRFDAGAGLYHFRHRELSTALGRWLQQDPIGFAAGDSNLYRYVNNSPTIATDPSGLLAPPRPDSVRVGSNDYGTIYFWHQPLPKDKPVGMEVIVQFHSSKKACCDEIAFVQVTRTVIIEDEGIFKAGAIVPPPRPPAGLPPRPIDKNGWGVDNIPGRFFGWYGYDFPETVAVPSGWVVPLGMSFATTILGISGVPRPDSVSPSSGEDKPAELGDHPRPGASNRKQVFITCAACRSGKDAGAIYGCITWGQTRDGGGNWSLINPQFTSWPGKEFFSGVDAWNADPGFYSLPTFFDPGKRK